MFASLKTYAALAAIASSANYASFVSAQADNTGVIVEGQACEAGEAMLLTCADASSLLVCNHNKWSFFSACPQGTVCSNDMCVNDDSVAVSPATSASPAESATLAASSATTGIAHDNDDDGDNGDEEDGDTDNTNTSSGSDTAASSSAAAGTDSNTDSASTSLNGPLSDTNVASELGSDPDNSNIVDNSNASELSDGDSDIVSNIGTLSEFGNFSELDSEDTSDDDWFESLKSSASTLPVGIQRISLTALSTLALSAVFTWIL